MPNPTYPLTTPRLILRPILPTETKPYRYIRSSPPNNIYSAIPDPLTRERSLSKGLIISSEAGQIDLFIILPSSSPSTPNQQLPELVLSDGTAIGVIQIYPPESSKGEKYSEIGGYVHYEFAGKGYGKEAFGKVVEYVLSNDGEGLGREEVCFECLAKNEPFLRLVRGLGLEDLGEPGEAWKDEKAPEESVKFVFGSRQWETAKRRSRESRS